MFGLRTGDYYDGYDDDDGGNDETHIEFDDVAATNVSWIIYSCVLTGSPRIDSKI